MASLELKIKNDSFIKVHESEAEARQHELQRGSCVRVDNIPFGFTTDRLKKYFAQYGKVLRANVPLNRATGKSARNRGYVLFAHLEIAKIAAASMNNYLMLGNLLKCSILDKNKVHWKMFRCADDKFHARNNEKILKLNSPSAAQEEADLRARHLEAVKLLQGLNGLLSASDLGITPEEVELAHKFAKSKKGQASKARQAKRAMLKEKRNKRRGKGSGPLLRPKLVKSKAGAAKKSAVKETKAKVEGAIATTVEKSSKKKRAPRPSAAKKVKKLSKNKSKKVNSKASGKSASE